MAAARLFAELTVLLVLLALPAILWLHGDLFRISVITRSLVFAMSVVSLIAMPAYGFITFKVIASDAGIATFSLWQRQQVPWSMIQSLRLKTFWGSRRYCIALKDGGEASFPVWLAGVKELADTIRSRLPDRGRTSCGGARVYDQNLPSTVWQVGKLLASFLFIALLWAFFYSLQKHKTGHADPTDALVILLACIVCTGMMVLRCIAIILMPRHVAVEPSGLNVATFFSRRAYAWSDLKGVSTPLFFLPEGMLIRTTKGFFLIGDQLEAFDELEEELAERFAPATVG